MRNTAFYQIHTTKSPKLEILRKMRNNGKDGRWIGAYIREPRTTLIDFN
jgi:hypothetical protein